MAWTVEFAADAEHDLSLIFDHLFATYKDLGEPDDIAFENAAARIIGIKQSATDLASNPYRGTRRDKIAQDLRNITINKAIIWFQIDEARKVVQVLAFFFGGQDHFRHMLRRLLDK
ncbi:hypothetical protein SAMN05444287_0261 [Octadecabacter temperatus]|uniref:Uncharacterized protein n=1 Tax=Octadecabacter temperatus TaxID=1458307 RepID=A0A0K0Y2K8_9RHOB|nr:hypothetical protein [Octadecabacter temperatus]AKS45169.1 hypothetical protein OSB_06080 [Octadecabacter temperatus]SIN87530.1 hypothetical protein SAMN05444287_0261 [Octadecabacter temperatus]